MTPGYKQTEVGVIPEEWEVRPFTHVTDLITCGIAATPEYAPESRGYPFLSSTNVKEGRILWSDYKHISAALHRQLYRNNPPKRGDILYSRVGTFGEAAVVEVDFEFSVYVSLTLIKPGKPLDSFYLMHLLNSDSYKRRAKDQVYLGGGVGNLNVDVVRRYPIVVPPLPEQRAIATALSDVDALLGALDRLIAKKRDLKQAAMQQLLTGQTRLPGFHGEWEVKRLGELIHLIPSGIYGEEKPREGLQPALVATTAHIETDDRWNTKEMSVRYFSQEKAHRYSIQEGDLIVVKSSGSAASIQSGKLGFVDSTRAGKFLFSNFLMLLRPTSIVQRFLYFYLCSHNVKKLLPTLVEASTYPNIRLGDYLDVEIPKPPPDEQTAIAEVLTEMDAELAVLEQRQEKIRALKQGMMQELLTGRVRLVRPEQMEVTA
ncbi:MAG: restriction endonuclease subunit S [Acidobacteriota bacterium]|nr:restriction endonuclease subunit S [Acidobacteriota bacterium]